MKRALVNNCGLFFTGYNAGVTAELCRLLGPGYFDAHFCSSGSVFGSTYCVANQPDAMETIWREHVCDGQLVHVAKMLQGRKVLDLDYLIDVFHRPDVALDLTALFAASAKVYYTLTHYDSGGQLIASPTRHDIWTLMRGTCAVPFLYHPIETAYGRVVDGGLSNPCPVDVAANLGFDEVVVVYNTPVSHDHGWLDSVVDQTAAWFLHEPLRRLLRSAKQRRRRLESKWFHHPTVQIIRPARPLPTRSWIDGDKRRLNATIDQGIRDARAFCLQLP